MANLKTDKRSYPYLRALTFLIGVFISVVFTQSLHAQNIKSIAINGNVRVEDAAILQLMSTKQSQSLSRDKVGRDIRKMYELGFFENIQVFSEPVGGGIRLVIEVTEKPAIIEIAFEGLEEISKEDFEEKLETKVYAIASDGTIASDIAVIEKEYAAKGFYLVEVGHYFVPIGKNEVKLVYTVNEGHKVRVGDVNIQGNKHFTDKELMNVLATRPLTRMGSLSSVAVFQEMFVKRDLEYLSLYYRDHGFAKVKIAKPIVLLDNDQQYIRVTFKVDEGKQYSIGKIKFTGDMLFDESLLREEMLTKEGNLFKYTKFARDVEYLIQKYGTLGYAYVDINPVPVFDENKNLVDLNIKITKGEKAYFGTINIVGNDKTRDNVIRREISVNETELYNGEKLSNSKRDIERLGFFEDVKIIKDRSKSDPQAVDLTVQIKEKATGQLQAALGYTPQRETEEQRVFFQGKYDEQNQSGKAWNLKLSGRWNGGDNYLLDLGFRDPRVKDSLWSAGARVFLSSEVDQVFTGVQLLERRYGGSLTVGRRVIERVRASITYKFENIVQDSLEFIPPRLLEGGISSSLIFSLSRNATNNFLDPSEGSKVSLSQRFTGGPFLMGDREYTESSLTGSYYFPIDFTDSYRTYFHFKTSLSYIYQLTEKDVPFFSRYRMGGYDDLRGYKTNSLGPKWSVLLSPTAPQIYNRGGDKSLLVQLEYFFPLIPEAGIKGILFTDWGNVFDNNETISFDALKKDVGFGIRWITPMAPFRFEWAYPIEDGELGDSEFIFYLGY